LDTHTNPDALNIITNIDTNSRHSSMSISVDKEPTPSLDARRATSTVTNGPDSASLNSAISSTNSSAVSSRQNSIYRHNHCNNQKPLNVSNAYIVNDKNQYDFDNLPDANDIALPNHSMDDINEISIDIGGSLAKMVYFTKDPTNSDGGVRINFYKIETDKIDDFISYIKTVMNKYQKKKITLISTGGGAHKYHDKLHRELQCKIQKEDEMQCLIIGLDFFITGIKNEVFYYDEDNNKYVEIDHEEGGRKDIGNNVAATTISIADNGSAADTIRDNQETSLVSSVYPYLLVNIGSGVSMIKVTGPNEGNFERVGGSSLGGGTLWGLLSILTDCNSFDEMLVMASNGNNENVDLLVGDIYGTGYNKIGLKPNHIASSMGKVFKEVVGNGNDGDDNNVEHHKLTREERLAKFNQQDIARSLLYAVSYNIGQIAYLQAQRYNLKKIYFAGSYIRNHNQTIRTLSFAIDFWSQGEKKAYFLNHEGYLGAMGAFLMRRNED
jgi:type II pantothenate kinase